MRDALKSVHSAASMPLEVVLVNARGGHHLEPGELGIELPCRLLNQGGNALERALAANLGLMESRGDFLLFLDDDDLVDADHLSRLLACLNDNEAALAAYTGVRLVDAAGNVLRELNEAWEPERLLGMNFLPIHAVMFRAEKVRDSIAFDPSLRLMEDWDFWVRLASKGNFVRLPGCSATYRLEHGESGLSGQRDKDAMYLSHALVLEKIRASDRSGISRALFWFDTALNHLQGEKAVLEASLGSANAYVARLEQRVQTEEATTIQLSRMNEMLVTERDLALAEVGHIRSAYDAVSRALATTQNDITLTLSLTKDELASAQHELATREEELALARNELANARNSVTLLLESTSWRITAPLRALVKMIRYRGNPDD